MRSLQACHHALLPSRTDDSTVPRDGRNRSARPMRLQASRGVRLHTARNRDEHYGTNIPMFVSVAFTLTQGMAPTTAAQFLRTRFDAPPTFCAMLGAALHRPTRGRVQASCSRSPRASAAATRRLKKLKHVTNILKATTTAARSHCNVSARPTHDQCGPPDRAHVPDGGALLSQPTVRAERSAVSRHFAK